LVPVLGSGDRASAQVRAAERQLKQAVQQGKGRALALCRRTLRRGRNILISEGNVVGDTVSRVDGSPHPEVMIAAAINAIEQKETLMCHR
jgi:hypothetical protein